jgi:aminoglycoside/choline kinase family phosphotransferase
MEDRIRQTLKDYLGERVAHRARLDNLGGHASLRIYWRIHLPAPADGQHYARGELTRMAMVLPDGANPTKSEEVSSGSASTELPFLNVQRYLKAMGLRVPEVDYVDMERGVVLEEDLGDETFEARYLELLKQSGEDVAAARIPIEQHYHRAIDLLVEIQRAELQARQAHDRPLPACIATERSFTMELLAWELDHYKEWGLEARGEVSLSARRLQRWEAAREAIVSSLVELPSTLVMRDYQSRNIMFKHDVPVLIDFQDALQGPFIYDLVALLRDSYIQLPFMVVTRLVDHYVRQGRAAGLPWCEERRVVHHAFHLQTVQRKLKDAGRFVFIDRVKGNPSFLPYYEPSIFYVRQALEALGEYDSRPEIEGLIELLTRVEPAFMNT